MSSPADPTALGALLEHAERERDAADAALRHAQSLLQQALAQADQLATYQREYDQRWGARAGRSASVDTLVQAHAFAQRLAQACRQQALTCERCQRQSEHARAVLLQREQRVAAVRKLIERRAQSARRLDERRSQRQSDESSMQLRARSRPSALSH